MATLLRQVCCEVRRAHSHRNSAESLLLSRVRALEGSDRARFPAPSTRKDYEAATGQGARTLFDHQHAVVEMQCEGASGEVRHGERPEITRMPGVQMVE